MILSKTNINTYLKHATENDTIALYQSLAPNQILSLPICPRCERLGLRDKGWALYRTMTCPHCGYHGVATHQLSAYLDEGNYR